MAKKSMIDKALEQGQVIGAAGAGFLGARFIENTVAGSVGTNSTMKRLGVRLGVPIASGFATRSASTNEYVQAAGLGMYVRGAVNAGQLVVERVQAMTSGGDSDVAAQRARPVRQRSLPRASGEVQEKRRRSGVLGPLNGQQRFDVV